MDFNLFDFQKPEDNLRKSLNPVGSALWNSVSAKVPFAQDTGVRNMGVRKKNVRTAPVESKEDSLINSFLSDSSVSETRKARLRSDLEGDLGKEGVYAILSTQGYEPPKKTEAKPEEKSSESVTSSASSILPQEGGFIDTFNKSVWGEVEKVKRAIATPFVEAPRIGANIAWAVMDVGGWKYFGHKDEGVLSASEELKKKGEELTAKWESAIGLEGTDKTVARTVTDLASGLAIPWGFGSTWAKTILQAKNLSVPAKLGLITAQWAVDAAKYSTVSRWDLTPTVWEVVTWAWVPIVWNVLKSVPKIAKFTWKSELLNNEAIRKGTALYKPGTDKIVGTADELKNALIRVWGEADDKAKQLTQSAIGKIDTKDVKSYEELGKRLQTKIDELSETRRKALENETKLFKPDDSKIEYDYKGTKTVSSPVEEAFDDLKTVSWDDLAKVNYFKSKFYGEEGLSANELDDLAKLHKRYNNAFASTWEIKRSKSDLESTRSGIKSLISSTESGKNASPIDKELSPLLNLRDRVDELAMQVDNIKAKIVTNYGEQAARLVTNISDLNKVRGLMKNLWGGWELKDTVSTLRDLDKLVGKDLEKIKTLSEAVNQKNSLESIKEAVKKVWGGGWNEVTRTVIKKPSATETVKKEVKKTPVIRKKNVPKPKFKT